MALPVGANDSAVSGVGGSWQMQKAQHRTVAMQSELVDIRVRPDASYFVMARFVFRNFGPAQTVTMGFPEGWGGDRDGSSGSTFRHFQTSVDGHEIRPRRVVTKRGEGGFSALWLKTVHFGAGQTRRVQVSYLSYGGGMSTGEKWVDYDFTGGNWRGKVRESVLTIQLPAGWYAVRPFDDLMAQPNPEMTRHGGSFRFRWTNWQAQYKFQLESRRLVRGGLYMDRSPVGFQKAMMVNSPGPVPDGWKAHAIDIIPDAITHNGHLWVSLSFLLRQRGGVPPVVKKTWNGEKRTLFLWKGRRYLALKMTKFAPYGAQALRHPASPFQLLRGSETEIFLPARSIEKALGQKFHAPRPDDYDPYALNFD